VSGDERGRPQQAGLLAVGEQHDDVVAQRLALVRARAVSRMAATAALSPAAPEEPAVES
jgi:hypothetical protein